MVFYGEYQVTLTSGGRLVLPKKIRALIKGNQFVLAKGFDHCLAGYDSQDWEKRSQEFLTTSLLATESLQMRRFLFSGAIYIDLDEQGRFVLPKAQSDFLNLTDRAVFVGVGDHFEIWSQAKWQNYLLKAAASADLSSGNA